MPFFCINTERLESFKLMMLIWTLLRMFLHRKICYFKTIFFPLNQFYEILECSFQVSVKEATQQFLIGNALTSQ